jgi:hypothetical protein
VSQNRRLLSKNSQIQRRNGEGHRCRREARTPLGKDGTLENEIAVVALGGGSKNSVLLQEAGEPKAEVHIGEDGDYQMIVGVPGMGSIIVVLYFRRIDLPEREA